MTNCKICGNSFKESPDSLILCEHKKGIVHKGCCTDICSLHGSPCEHCVAVYDKVKEKNNPLI